MKPEPKTAAGCRPWFTRAAIWGSVLLLIAFLFPQSGIWIFAELALGWFGFLKRILPQITTSWDLIGMALVCLVGFFAGSHWFLKWLIRAVAERKRAGSDADESEPTPVAPPWKPQWTLAINGLIWLSFFIGMSSIGIVHQACWMAASDEPMMVVTRGGNSPQRMAKFIYIYFAAEKIDTAQELESVVIGVKTPDTLQCPLSRTDPNHVRAYLLVKDGYRVYGAIVFRTVYSGEFYSEIGVYDSHTKDPMASLPREQLPKIMRRYQDELHPFL